MCIFSNTVSIKILNYYYNIIIKGQSIVYGLSIVLSESLCIYLSKYRYYCVYLCAYILRYTVNRNAVYLFFPYPLCRQFVLFNPCGSRNGCARVGERGGVWVSDGARGSGQAAAAAAAVSRH